MSNWPVMAGTCVVGGALGLTYASSLGTVVTDTVGGGTTKGYGAWVQLSAALPYATAGIWLGATSGNMDYVEIGVGAGGSEQVVAEVFAQGIVATGRSEMYLPIALNKGQRVAARVSSTNVWSTTDTIDLYLRPALMSWLCPVGFSKVVLLANAANNDSGGTANTLSAWAEVAASTAAHAKAAIVVAANVGAGATNSSAIWNLGVGAAGSEIVVAAGTLNHVGYQGDGAAVTIPIDIPAGSRVAIRHQASSNATGSSRNTSFAVHLCY